MTKTGFIDYVKAFVNDHAPEGAKSITKKGARTMVEGVFGALVDALTSGNEVAIPGVIKFGLNVIPERSGVSPLTGQPFTTPEHLRCNVKIAKASGNEVAIPGVIKFGLNVIPERSGVSPLTGQPFTTPEHLRCNVKIAKAVREEIAKANLVEAEDADSED